VYLKRLWFDRVNSVVVIDVWVVFLYFLPTGVAERVFDALGFMLYQHRGGLFSTVLTDKVI